MPIKSVEKVEMQQRFKGIKKQYHLGLQIEVLLQIRGFGWVGEYWLSMLKPLSPQNFQTSMRDPWPHQVQEPTPAPQQIQSAVQ